MSQEYNNNFVRPEVQHNISNLEGVINRMANNSSNCKNWMLGIIAAGAALQPSVEVMTEKILFALIPIILFCLLDSYYLGLEKYFREKMADFIKEARNNGNGYEAMLYKFEKRTACEDVCAVFKGFFSFATWPLYVTMIVLVLLIHYGVILL